VRGYVPLHLVALGVWEVALGRDGLGAAGVGGHGLELVPVVAAEAAEIGVSQRVAAPLARRAARAGRAALLQHRVPVDLADLFGLARRQEQSQQRDRHGHGHGLVDAHPSRGHQIDRCLGSWAFAWLG